MTESVPASMSATTETGTGLADLLRLGLSNVVTGRGEVQPNIAEIRAILKQPVLKAKV